MTLFMLAAALQEAVPAEAMAAPAAAGTGLEWMPIASFVVPAVLLVVLIWLGQRHTVS